MVQMLREVLIFMRLIKTLGLNCSCVGVRFTQVFFLFSIHIQITRGGGYKEAVRRKVNTWLNDLSD